MRGLLIALLFVGYICAKGLYSIKSANNNVDKETWDINIDRCYEGEIKACRIIADSGLKSIDNCKAKGECANIGRVYFNLGMIDDSLAFFKKSCGKKYGLGCYFIGRYHENNKDFRIAKDIYEKSCSRNTPITCFSLGELYANGGGVRQDYVMAAMMYKKACRYKEKHAFFALASLYGDGNIGYKDLPLSKELYGISCDLGYQKGCDEYKALNKSGIPSIYEGTILLDNVFNGFRFAKSLLSIKILRRF